MKRLYILALLTVTGLMVTAQKASWKEMHDFHAVMSRTFHPAEDNNLQPARENATSLWKLAKTWQESALPSGYEEASIKPILQELVTSCEGLQAAVKANETDAALKKRISEAHDIFHKIMEKCRK